MNFFKKIFGTKEILHKENEFDKLPIKEDVVINTEIYSGETIYEYKGINVFFIKSLYFIDPIQKDSIVKYYEKLAEKLNLINIKSSKEYEDYLMMGEQIEKFENTYKEKYKNYSEYLTFPYFNERNIFLFDYKTSTILKKNGVIVKEDYVLNEYKPDTFEENSDAWIFNVENKSFNIISDISQEENLILNFLEKNNLNFYYYSFSLLKCLIRFYIKQKNLDKVNELISKEINWLNERIDFKISKKETDDIHKFENDFILISNLYWDIGNKDLYKAFLLKGIEFIKNNCQIPKTKTTGEIYKRYAELLYELGKYNEALEIINELNLYNKNIPYKQLQAKIDKALAI